ncbi:MAG: TatD family deoxyribonuclease [Dehalococcoidia bacterium]|nr:MAG: TatD family deoxyribonuclease [Dehalococcoidia bacterium]
MPELSPQKAIRLIDSHAHLDMSRFDADRDVVIQRATQAGVTSIINVGIDLASSQKAIEMAQRYPTVLAAVGIHPQEVKNISENEIGALADLARKPEVVAIGEIGLDFYRDYAPHEQQIKALKWQLALADEMQLPAIIHCRQAEKEILEVLTDWRARHSSSTKSAGVIHCFNGTLKLAENYLNLGFYISLGAYIGYPSSRAFREVVKQLPTDRLLTETDCPFLPPQSHRGQRNEPAYVVEIAKELANIKEMRLEEVSALTSANAARLFGIPDLSK